MDPFQIKKDYGDQVVLWGGVGLQETMAQPSAAKVCDDTRALIRGWTPGGGTLACPANVLPIDVPFANVVAFFETVEEASREEYRRLGF
jgi:uroporphyrinogen decarboxylase